MMRFAVGLLGLLFAPALTFAQGGPPLIVDDPGTPGDSHWEINLAARGQWSEDKRVIALPYVDLNYGWGEHLQLKFEAGWATESERGAHDVSGLSNSLAGVKIRFLDEETMGVAMSTYPQVEFHGPLASNLDRLNDDGSHLVLPLEASKAFGRWGVNPEVGIDLRSRGDTEYFCGVAMAYQVFKEKELLWEVRGRSELHSDQREWLYNFGVRWRLREGLSLIASAGHSFTTLASDGPFFMSYLGTQLTF